MTDTSATTDDRSTQAMEDEVSYYLDCEYCPPVGGFPQANPNGTRVPVSSRAQSVPSSDAAREMGAYSEADYQQSIMGSRRIQRRTPALKRGRTQKVGGAYGNARDPEPSDAVQFESFEEGA